MDDLISRKAAISVVGFAMGDSPSITREDWNAIIEALEGVPSAQPEPQWIPCSERLPREYTRVLGYMAWKSMTAIEYLNGRWYSIDHLEPLPDEAVIAWMPLPKPPKEGDE